MDIELIAEDAMMTDFYSQRVYACNKTILHTFIIESSMLCFNLVIHLYVSLAGQ